MKTRILAFLLTLILLLSLASCARERYDALYISSVGGRIFTVRGEDGVVKQISVKENDKVIWAKKVKVDESVGKQSGTYGLTAVDLNFDGALDIMLMQSVSGETVSYLCWIWDAKRETYVASTPLSSLLNIKVIPERSALLAFHREDAVRDGRVIGWTDAATQYVWKNGELTPERRIALTYFTETNSYCLAAKLYNSATQSFDIDIDGTPDRWFFSQPELDAYDLSQLYYFK